MNQTIYLDDNHNEIRFSEIKKIESDVAFKGLGIKYVASGEETYYANGKKFMVREGEYIIGNDFTKSIVQINQEKVVEGICIDISTQIVSDHFQRSTRKLKTEVSRIVFRSKNSSTAWRNRSLQINDSFSIT